MSSTTKAGFYIIKQDKDGNVLLFLPAYIGEPKEPVILYDGKEHAVFSRNKELSIILDYVNPDIREILSNAGEVIVVEARGQEILSHYTAKIKNIENIPLQWEKYGLSSWDKVLNKEEGKI
ncbi:MAG: hypothetical protein LBR70_01825 [Lactobacillaceae bacterium]|jgi:hypothetical protein|nr:hypothetical protein [Lactobacillaceae bacterium]